MKQINNISELQRKNRGIPLFGGKGPRMKGINGYDTGEEGGGSRHSC